MLQMSEISASQCITKKIIKFFKGWHIRMNVRVNKSKAVFRRKFTTMLPSIGRTQKVRFSADIAALTPIKLLFCNADEIIPGPVSSYPFL